MLAPPLASRLVASRLVAFPLAVVPWLVALLGVACGAYQPLEPRLPGQARSLALGPVRNLTPEPELDLRFKQSLRWHLAAQPQVQLRNPGWAELFLEVTLLRFQIQSDRGTTASEATKFSLLLEAEYSLTDQREDKILHAKQRVRVSGNVEVSARTLENPAIRDRAVEKAVDDLSRALIRRILKL